MGHGFHVYNFFKIHLKHASLIPFSGLSSAFKPSPPYFYSHQVSFTQNSLSISPLRCHFSHCAPVLMPHHATMFFCAVCIRCEASCHLSLLQAGVKFFSRLCYIVTGPYWNFIHKILCLAHASEHFKLTDVSLELFP